MEAKRCYWLVYTLIGSLVLLEAALHVHFWAMNGTWLFVAQKNFRVPYVQPTADRREYTLKRGYSDASTSINDLGFRGALPRRVGNRPLVCFMGDSVPYGAGVSDSGTLPVHLEDALAKLGLPAIVLNGGVPSYNLRQSMDRWRLDVAPRWKCDLIILNAANDVSLLDFYGKDWSPNLTWASARFGISGPSWSSTAYYVRLASRSLSGSINLQLEPFAKALSADLSEQLARPKALGIPIVLASVTPCYYRADLRNAASEAACAGYRSYAVLAAKWQPIIDTVNGVLAAAADGRQVHYVDWAEFLDRHGREGRFVDFIHFSDVGAKDVAEFLAAFLQRQGLIKPQ